MTIEFDQEKLAEYHTLCDLQFQRTEALRAYVINQTDENKRIAEEIMNKINVMVEKAINELFV